MREVTGWTPPIAGSCSRTVPPRLRHPGCGHWFEPPLFRPRPSGRNWPRTENHGRRHRNPPARPAAFEEAERLPTAERRAWLSFVIVGGGPTGVELAGALGEIANDTLRTTSGGSIPAKPTSFYSRGATASGRVSPGPFGTRGGATHPTGCAYPHQCRGHQCRCRGRGCEDRRPHRPDSHPDGAVGRRRRFPAGR